MKWEWMQRAWARRMRGIKRLGRLWYGDVPPENFTGFTIRVAPPKPAMAAVPWHQQQRRRHRLLRLRRRRAIFASYHPPEWAYAVVLYIKKDNPAVCGMICYRSRFGDLLPIGGSRIWKPDSTWQLFDIWTRPNA